MILKSRAWDTYHKKWIKHFYITENGLIYNMQQMHRDIIGAVPIEKSGLIVMQSTGLFDDTGQEIFEGDVVLVVSEEFGLDTAIVKSDNFGFYLEYLDMDIFPERLNELKLEIKVVCNIYENPDLLEVTDD